MRAADYIYTGDKIPDFDLPGTCKMICNYRSLEKSWKERRPLPVKKNISPYFSKAGYGKCYTLFTNHEFLSR